MTTTVLLTVAGIVVIFVRVKGWSSVSRKIILKCLQMRKHFLGKHCFPKILCRRRKPYDNFSNNFHFSKANFFFMKCAHQWKTIRETTFPQQSFFFDLGGGFWVEGNWGRLNLWQFDYWFSLKNTSLNFFVEIVLKRIISWWNTNKVDTERLNVSTLTR